MEFPESLQPYQQLIESTAMPTALLFFTEEKTKLYQSKIGGKPYFPKDYPVDYFYVPYPNTANYTPWPKHPTTGKELPLLIQINFEEMPPLPSFPRTGILQLFIDEACWNHLEDNLRVIYHPTVIKDEQLLFTEFNNPQESQLVQENSISFDKEVEYMTNSDYRFEQYEAIFVNGGNNQVWKDYWSITGGRYYKKRKQCGYGSNKIGGYHYSQNCQDPRASPPRWHDPRAQDPEWKDSILLVQFQDYENLTWGDCGSAQFFIKRKDLEALNFSDLLFHWDST